jgi:membrane protease YdiL (CAAX protease family)
VYLVTAFAIGKVITIGLKLIMGNPAEAPFASWTHSILWVVANCGLTAGALIVLRWFDRRPTALLGLGFNPGWVRESSAGLVSGFCATGVLAVILIVSGSVSVAVSPQPAESLASMPRYLFIFLMAATVEELVFRGYPLQVLAEGSRRWIAGALLCIIFTMGHANNPDVTIIGIVNIFLASIVLTVLYFQTRRLWLPIAIHLSWNFSQSWLLGFDVSGIEIDDKLLVMTPTGSDLISGGEFGLEGSILSTILFVIVTVWLLVRPVLRPTGEVAALWVPYPAGFGLDPALPPDIRRSTPDEEQESESTAEQGGEPDSGIEF